MAIVTGAASGIGRATALRLASEGAAVAVADIDPAGAEDTRVQVARLGAATMAVVVDVSEDAQVARCTMMVREQFNRIDILHNCAAITQREFLAADTTVVDLDLKVWERSLAVDLQGTMLFCRHVIPVMLEHGSGSIVNTSSGAAVAGQNSLITYSVAKAGVETLTRHVATTYGKRGIRCNAVRPGVVLTPSVLASFSPRTLEILRRHHLTPDLGTPDDIAATVSFLVSDDAAFINGAIIPVDGGLHAHQPHWSEQSEAFDQPPPAS